MSYLRSVGAAAFLVALAACAEGANAAHSGADCLNEATTNTEFLECTRTKIDEAESELKAEYRRLLESFGGDETEQGRALTREQEKWRKFRESACETYFVNWGREGEILHGPLCIASVVEHRANDLYSRYTTAHPEDSNPAKEEETR